MKRNKRGQFIKGSNGNTFEGFGVWYDKKGYPTIWINGKNIKVHVYVWEKKNGSKPKGYDLHHKDFDKSNYNIDNIELLSFSDHRKIHAGWIRNNKGEWLMKPCKDCNMKLPLNQFYQRTGLTPSNRCIKCSSEYHKNKFKTDFDYREKRIQYLKEYYKKNKTSILQKQKDARKKNRA